jgi:hypothetical protein
VKNFAFLALVACGNDKPPPLGDTDATKPTFEAGIVAEAGAVDAGGDGATNAFYTDYEGICPTNSMPQWRYHDFMTKTPGDSAIDFSAQTAAAISDFTTAPSVHLAHVTGPDITVWSGVDVDPKLRTIGEKSLHYLRVTTVFQVGEAGAPTLVDVRQQYDCVATQ